jgi:hypothetical protein
MKNQYVKRPNSVVSTVTFYRLATWGMSDDGGKIFIAHPDGP